MSLGHKILLNQGINDARLAPNSLPEKLFWESQF